MMPVVAIARQSRSFYAQHGTHLACAYFGDKVLKSGSLYLSGTRPAEVLVNDFHRMKAQTPRVIGKTVLTPLAFLIVYDLSR